MRRNEKQHSQRLGWFIYILLCRDGSFYCGSTNDLKKRFIAHQAGKGGSYTRSHKVISIIHSEQFRTQSEALKREIEIKSWNRDKKILKLKLDI